MRPRTERSYPFVCDTLPCRMLYPALKKERKNPGGRHIPHFPVFGGKTRRLIMFDIPPACR